MDLTELTTIKITRAMKKLIILLFIVSTMCMVMPSCGPSEKEIREKIEKERQDSIKAEEAKAEALRLEEEKKREEEEQKKEREWKSSEIGKGWALIKSRLKSPSTASLVNHVGTDAQPCKDLAEKIGLPGLEVAMYELDAQNGFGAMIRTNYIVFYKNGEPILADNAESLARCTPSTIRTTLELNGY